MDTLGILATAESSSSYQNILRVGVNIFFWLSIFTVIDSTLVLLVFKVILSKVNPIEPLDSDAGLTGSGFGVSAGLASEGSVSISGSSAAGVELISDRFFSQLPPKGL